MVSMFQSAFQMLAWRQSSLSLHSLNSATCAQSKVNLDPKLGCRYPIALFNAGRFFSYLQLSETVGCDLAVVIMSAALNVSGYLQEVQLSKASATAWFDRSGSSTFLGTHCELPSFNFTICSTSCCKYDWSVFAIRHDSNPKV